MQNFLLHHTEAGRIDTRATVAAIDRLPDFNQNVPVTHACFVGQVLGVACGDESQTGFSRHGYLVAFVSEFYAVDVDFWRYEPAVIRVRQSLVQPVRPLVGGLALLVGHHDEPPAAETIEFFDEWLKHHLNVEEPFRRCERNKLDSHRAPATPRRRCKLILLQGTFCGGLAALDFPGEVVAPDWL